MGSASALLAVHSQRVAPLQEELRIVDCAAAVPVQGRRQLSELPDSLRALALGFQHALAPCYKTVALRLPILQRVSVRRHIVTSRTRFRITARDV